VVTALPASVRNNPRLFTKCCHNMHQIRFWPELSSGPRWGAQDAPAEPLVGWVWDTPPHSPLLGAYGASILTPSAFVSAPRFQRSATSFFCTLQPKYHTNKLTPLILIKIVTATLFARSINWNIQPNKHFGVD